MVEKSVNLKDKKTGDILRPKTYGSNVTNNAGETLGAVEAGAQVNKIEKIQLNGVEVTPDSTRTVNLKLDGVGDTYDFVQQTTAESGNVSTYYMTKNGVQTGAKINIPKDLFVDDCKVKVCTEADKPVTGYKVDDKYIDFTFKNSEKHMYLNVNDILVDYTPADDTVSITGRTIKVNLDELKKTFASKGTTASSYGITDVYTKAEVDAMNWVTYEVL